MGGYFLTNSRSKKQKARTMQKFLRLLGNGIAVGLLTLFTQFGGLLWLACWPLFYWINNKITDYWQRVAAKTAFFSAIYLSMSFFVIPPLAKWESGRVPLTVWGHPHLKPHHVFYYCVLNHHYVRPEVLASCESVAVALADAHPGAVLYYLDANFPFFDGYPLQPHFTHRHGTTMDIALHWQDAHSSEPIQGAPTPLAYGASALPLPGEVDWEDKCRQQGNWYRSIEMKMARPFYREADFKLDEARTKALARLFAEQPNVKKILLEPHLKARLGLSRFDKVRFQGCRAARHDDHIHVVWKE